ncbi:MAG: hypothetical protein R3C01_01950 [Planctomycetaceae bacterium]
MVLTGRLGWNDDGPIQDVETRRLFDDDDPLDGLDLDALKPSTVRRRVSQKKTVRRGPITDTPYQE